MPCNDGGQRECWEEKYGTNNPDKLREMLCQQIHQFLVLCPKGTLQPNIEEWWLKHKQWDKKRKENK